MVYIASDLHSLVELQTQIESTIHVTNQNIYIDKAIFKMVKNEISASRWMRKGAGIVTKVTVMIRLKTDLMQRDELTDGMMEKKMYHMAHTIFNWVYGFIYP